jgi:hypothetical protein
VGSVYVVECVVISGTSGRLGLGLKGVQFPDCLQNADWADHFRKIRPDEHEACEPEFIQLLKRSKVPEPVSVSITRANSMSALFDVAAHALKRGDFTAFDEAMARFKRIKANG